MLQRNTHVLELGVCVFQILFNRVAEQVVCLFCTSAMSSSGAPSFSSSPCPSATSLQTEQCGAGVTASANPVSGERSLNCKG